MISCDECQEKIVAVFDNEGSQGDRELTSAHLRDCPECRAFHQEMVKVRQLYSVATAARALVTIGKDFMQTVEADAVRSSNVSREKHRTGRALFFGKLPRLAWACGVAALFLIAASWLVCFILAREVGDLRQELDTARQEVAAAQAERQLREAQEREQKAIAALFFRMQELEERVDRFSSPRTTFLPAEQNGLSNGPGQM
jgi:anti-sigma factor RsiW